MEFIGNFVRKFEGKLVTMFVGEAAIVEMVAPSLSLHSNKRQGEIFHQYVCTILYIYMFLHLARD